MNELETQLSRLFNAAVGELPNQVTASAARRQAVKRRIITCISATAALAVAGSIGLAVSASAIVPHKVTSSHPALARPKFYFTEDLVSAKRNISEDVVRSSATGAVTGWVSCPGPHPVTVGVAVSADQTFFIDCQVSENGAWAGTRVYRFGVTSSGRISGFGLVPGGNLAGLRGANLAVTADGSMLGIDVAKARKGPISEVLLINTKTGRHTIWHADNLPGGVTFHPYDLSFAHGGRELAVFGYDGCAAGVGSHCRKDPGQEMRAVSPAGKGGNLSSGHRIFVQSQAEGTSHGWVQDAFISPDGSTVTFGLRAYPADGVFQLSVATGRTLRTLFRTGKHGPGLRSIAVDPTGRFVLYNGFAARITPVPDKQPFDNGWIDHKKLRLLKPAHGYIELFAW